MPSRSEPAGCRNAAIATTLLVGLALVFMAIGLTLVNDRSCESGCETLGLTLLYGGLPVSAVLGIVSGDLVLAWPLDITLWVVLGFFLARAAERRGRGVLGSVLVTILVTLLYGLVLAQLVEIAI